jgi:hypothetical protein
LIRRENTDKDADRHHTDPPPDNVSDEVNLLAVLVLARPETDPAEEERPVDRSRSVRVRVGETGVVLEHGDLELEELAEEVHRRGLAGRRLLTTEVDGSI